MTPDRRHEDHPTPPPGCPDRRDCADEGCRAARQEWLKNEVIPAIERKMYMMIAASVVACAASFVWLHDITNSRLELKIRETYEDRAHHDEDIKRMEGTVREINSNLSRAMDKILDNQGIIMDAIRAGKRK